MCNAIKGREEAMDVPKVIKDSGIGGFEKYKSPFFVYLSFFKKWRTANSFQTIV